MAMSSFLKFKATKKLIKLAKKPFDLSKPGNLTPARLKKYVTEGCGFKFLYGTEQITDDVIATLEELAKESDAVAKMSAMQRGEVMNFVKGYPSENRPVLHTAVRDFFDKPSQTKICKDAVKLAKTEIEKLKAFLQKTDKKFTDLVMIAIGGSDLGPRANCLALMVNKLPKKNVHFISNVDPDDAATVLKGLDLSRTVVAVVSKSGTTLETVTNEELVRARFEKAGLKSKDHFVAVTGEGSPMDNKSRYLESFHMWDWVGGRFSSSSLCGGLVLSFACGFDVYWEFLKGANAMDLVALEKKPKKNLPLLAALIGIWNHNFLGYPTLALIPYSQGLFRYPAHIQQVDMESNGKWIDQDAKHVRFQTGPIIWGEPGTNAQHSFFQLLHQGTATVPIEFIGFKETQYNEDFKYQKTTSQQKLIANMFAQSLALATGKDDTNPNKFFPGNRPSHILLGKKLTPFAVGALLSYYEHKVAFQGFIWGINSFDQEGVQLGKVLANKIIDRMGNKTGKPYPLGDALIKQLETL
jgi:glucose-6-phosphate isomerase